MADFHTVAIRMENSVQIFYETHGKFKDVSWNEEKSTDGATNTYKFFFDWSKKKMENLVGIKGNIRSTINYHFDPFIVVDNTLFHIEDPLKPVDMSFPTAPYIKHETFVIHIYPVTKYSMYFLTNTWMDEKKNDAVLLIENQKFPVISSILAFHSKYFKKVFDSKEDNTPIELPKGTLYYFAFLLRTFISDIIMPKDHDIVPVLELATFYGIPLASRVCETALIECKSETLAKKLILAKTHNLKALFAECVKRMDNGLCNANTINELKELRDSEHFEHLPKDVQIAIDVIIAIPAKEQGGTLKVPKSTKKKTNVSWIGYVMLTEKAKLDAIAQSYKPNKFTDCEIIIDGYRLHANKQCLAVHSDYFRAMFSNDNFMESRKSEVEMSGLDSADFLLLLWAIHTDGEQPTEKNALNVLCVADQFGFLQIMSICENIVIKMKEMNIAEKLLLGNQYELKKLLNWCTETLLTGHQDKKALAELLEFTESEDFNQLPEKYQAKVKECLERPREDEESGNTSFLAKSLKFFRNIMRVFKIFRS